MERVQFFCVFTLHSEDQIPVLLQNQVTALFSCINNATYDHVTGQQLKRESGLNRSHVYEMHKHMQQPCYSKL